jgi:hypothetical protein
MSQLVSGVMQGGRSAPQYSFNLRTVHESKVLTTQTKEDSGPYQSRIPQGQKALG